MNSVQLVGRLVRDVDIRYTDGGTSVSRFTVAVNRRFGKTDEADFISCVAFGKTAEFVEKYFGKGQRIGLTGRIQTGSYTKNEGTKIYTTDVIAELVEFVESKKSGEQDPAGGFSGKTGQGFGDNDGFMPFPDLVEDEDLPFN